MSIFKETFPKFVRDQLRQREEIISSGTGRQIVSGSSTFNFSGGNRDKNFYTYTLNKQCTIRLTSGVKVIDDTILSEAFTGDEISLAYRLEGGIKDGNTNRGGIGGAYGDSSIRSDAANGFGIVPMPGITSANIKTKSAYGSLREAKVQFVCHNQRQLEILELLYMRPGYTLLLEWGWTPYIDNDGNTQNINNYIDDFFDDNMTTKKLEQTIIDKKEKSGGNYDALMGYCKNFNYTLRDDGGYNCETEIIAKGEVLESLKDTDVLVDTGTSRPRIELLLGEIIQHANGFAGATNEEEDAYDSGVTLLSLAEKLELSGVTTLSPWILSQGPGSFQIEEFQKNIRDNNGWFWGFGGDADLEDAEGWFTGNRRNSTSWIRWDAFCFLLNKYAIPHNDEGALIELQCHHVQKEDTDNPILEPLLYTDETNTPITNWIKAIKGKDENGVETQDTLNWAVSDISYNPEICILPHNLFLHFGVKGDELFGNYKTAFQPLVKSFKKISKLKDSDLERELDNREQAFQIGGIYLGVEYLFMTFKGLYYDEQGNEKEDYSLIKFLKKIWEDVNNCTCNNHEFDLHVDSRPGGQIIRVIDMQVQPELDVNSLHQLKIQSLDSVVREVEYNTSIPSSLTATIAVAAQAPDSIDDLDKVTFAAINRGIIDRFAKKVGKKDDAISQEQRDEWAVEFDLNLLNLFEALHIKQAFGKVDLGGVINKTAGNIVGGSIIAGSAAVAGATGFLASNPIGWSAAVIGGAYFTLSAVGDATTDKYNNFGGHLNDLLYYYYNINDNDYLTEEAGGNLNTEETAIYRGAIKNVTKALEYFQKVYGSDYKGKYRGQPFYGSSRRLSSIIPLKFNASLDGISGIIIGNVFKLPKNRLPISYSGDDICFIVMGEEQSVTPGQDWTTSIKGNLILLGEGQRTKEYIDWETSYTRMNGVFKYDPEVKDRLERDYAVEIADAYEFSNDVGYYNSPLNPPCQSFAERGEKSITSTYGIDRDLDGDGEDKVHNGIDVEPMRDGLAGDPMYAVGDGVIVKAKNTNPGGYGLMVTIELDDFDLPDENVLGGGYKPKFARYAHCLKALKPEGTRVKKGEVVALMGGEKGEANAGNSLGVHLHFEMLDKNKNFMNPIPWLNESDSWDSKTTKKVRVKMTGFSQFIGTTKPLLNQVKITQDEYWVNPILQEGVWGEGIGRKYYEIYSSATKYADQEVNYVNILGQRFPETPIYEYIRDNIDDALAQQVVELRQEEASTNSVTVDEDDDTDDPLNQGTQYSGASSRSYGGGMSDKRLKTNITKVGNTEYGIPLYEFNYKNTLNLDHISRFRGIMAQDLLKTNMSKAVILNDNGYYSIDYDQLNINLEKV